MSRTKRLRRAKSHRGDYVTAAEAGLMLGLTARSVARHCKAGRFSGAKLLVGWIIPRKSVALFKAPERGRPAKESRA